MSLLSRHVAAGLDPVKLAERIGMDCDPWQAEALRAEDDQTVLNVHRQGGKSTVASVKALHRALYTPESLVLIVSPTDRQSGELFRKVLVAYRALGRPVPAESENQTFLTLENGSRVIAVPGSESNIRTYSVDLLVIDEASRVPDDLWAAVSPMLAVTRGQVVAMSTPFGKRGWWYQAAQSSHWRTVTVPATECPRISPEWLAAERDAIGDFWYRQEFLCEFIDAAGQMFSTEDIEAIFAGDSASLDSDGILLDFALDAVGPGAEEHRRKVRRAHLNTVREDARRKSHQHMWGPPVGDRRRCVRCPEEVPA